MSHTKDAMAELLAKQEAERVKLAREIEVATRLPLPPQSIHAFKDAIWLTYASPGKYGLRDSMSLTEALDIVRAFNTWEHADGIEPVEHWKSGCVYVQPAEKIADNVKEHGECVGHTEIELSIEGGEGFSGQKLHFWIKDKRDGQWYRPSIEVRTPLHASMRETRGYRNRRRYDVNTQPDGTLYRHWSSGDGGFIEKSWHLSVYWQSVGEFEEWVTNA